MKYLHYQLETENRGQQKDYVDSEFLKCEHVEIFRFRRGHEGFKYYKLNKLHIVDTNEFKRGFEMSCKHIEKMQKRKLLWHISTPFADKLWEMLAVAFF